MPGSPTWVSKSSTYSADLLHYQQVWDYKQKAIQADYEFDG